MLTATLEVSTIRIFLHVLSVTVWVGGQIVMMGIMPILKEAGIDGLPAKVAKGFQALAWPAMAVAIFTGLWNILALNSVEKSFGWNMTFGIKFLFVVASGAGALMHSKTDDPKKKGLFGAIGFITAIVAMFLGYVI